MAYFNSLEFRRGTRSIPPKGANARIPNRKVTNVEKFLKILKWTSITLVTIVVVLAVAILLHARGPNHSYRADLSVPAPGTPPATTPVNVGVAKVDITPNLFKCDKFIDVDGDNLWKPTGSKRWNDPAAGDHFEDTNGNGKLDAIFIAGFGNNRPAQGVHDPLWARAIAFDNNGVRVVMVTVDSIGIFHDKIIQMRQKLDPALNITHLMVSSLHNHETPDTMGIWSAGFETPHLRFNEEYMQQVIDGVVDAAQQAVKNLQPAEAILAQVKAGADEGFLDDSRKPLVYDDMMHCARFVKPGTDETIATMVEWGNHPETLGGDNPLLTSDFCHYWREGVENGVGEPNGVQGLGGMCLYFQGMVGGLMTQLHTTVPHRDGKQTFSEGTFEKAQALGENLAIKTVKALRGTDAKKMTGKTVAVVAKSVFVEPKPLFKVALLTGLVHPGLYSGFKFRTEVDAIRVGGIEIATWPGEVYSEIGYGGVEAPTGQDFFISPVETPPIYSEMKGELNMLMGLANDEIGYIIPKSQWDDAPPYAYGRTDKPQYGEQNSFGPEVAPTLHAASRDVLHALHEIVGN